MIQLDGIDYNINTTDENTAAMLSNINTYCSDNDIRNTKNEVIEISSNWANPLYHIVRGLGYLVSQLQSLIYSAGCSFSVAASNEKQLLNIADIAGVKRRKATRTSIVATAYSTDTEDCQITTALSMSITSGDTTVIFHPAFDVSVPAGSSRTIMLIAEIYGAFSIQANSNASFDTNPAGLRLLVTEASSPGQDIESISALRVRIQRRLEKGTLLDKAIDAITALDGVSLCNIYFNESINETTSILGIDVPPKQALIFVQGWSPDITETFYRYMLCKCAGASHSGALAQTYTMATGQTLTAYIIPPTNVPVYITIYVNQVVDDVTKQAMKDVVASLARKRTIGESLTSVEVIDILQASYPEYAFAGCIVSADGATYGYQATIEAHQLVVFDSNNIVITSREA